MTDFYYIAVDKLGKIKRGTISFSNSEEARKSLALQEFELISCEEQKNQASNIMNIGVGDLFRSIFQNKITPVEKISFAHHLSVMLKAGIPIIESVEVLGSESASFKFKEIIKNLIRELQKGKPISFFLEKEKFFSIADLAILKAGEASGKLSESLTRIGNDLKRDYQMKKKITGAMAYPSIILLALLGISGFIIVFVLPKVGEVFQQMNLKMPLPTRILLALGSFIANYFIQILLVFICLSGVLFFILRTTNLISKFFPKIISSIPVIKKVVYQIEMSRFIRSLSSLLSSGVPIADSLKISGEVFINNKRREIIKSIGEKVKKGISLSSSFKDHHKLFGGILVKMCSVGEKSGRLSEILQDLALFYEEEVEQKLENFSTIIEPILMLLVGLGVGGMILSIVGPIYQMMGSLSQ